MNKIEIIDVNLAGAGIGRNIEESDKGDPTLSKNIIVPFSLPGDLLEKSTPNSSTNNGLNKYNILTPSRHRQEPPCSAFPSCSGCSFMHANSNWQIKFKENKKWGTMPPLS